MGPYLGQAKEVAWEYLRRFAEPIITLKNEGELWISESTGRTIQIASAAHILKLSALVAVVGNVDVEPPAQVDHLRHHRFALERHDLRLVALARK